MKNIKAEYVPTKKNTVAADFYEKAGFNLVKDGVYEAKLCDLVIKRAQLSGGVKWTN